MKRNSVLLIISGSIAAYKSLDLIRRLRELGLEVRCILTKGGEQFITPLSVSSISGTPTYTDLFSLKDETEMGHIRLVREANLVVVAPASADIIAKMANGLADDLATAALLANDKPVLVAPAMNEKMWNHPATKRNVAQIQKDGAKIIAPGAGALACGEVGEGRMADVDAILQAILEKISSPFEGEGREGGGAANPTTDLRQSPLPLIPSLKGRGNISVLVTSGPTFEAIDPVRFLGNRSSGRQGHAVAAALAARGAQVTLVAGPTKLPDPEGVDVIHVTTAEEMLAACERALPVDVAIFAAAVSDWRAKNPAEKKIKKSGSAPTLSLLENPDIASRIGHHKKRPKLVIGFAAETENLLKNAAAKRKNKGADWIIANDASAIDANDNEVTLLTGKSEERWPRMSKEKVAEKLADKIIAYLQRKAA